MSKNHGAWGVALWKDGRGGPSTQADGISLSGGWQIDPYLPTTPLGCLLLPPAGMGVPPVRQGDVVFAQRDGVVQFGDYYEPRQITLQVLLENDDCPGCNSSPGVDGALLLDGVSPGRATAPDHDLTDITGDIDLRAHVALDQWVPGVNSNIIGKWDFMDGQRSYGLQISAAGRIRILWSVDGVASNVADSLMAPEISDGEALWVRAALDVDNGSGSRETRFYTSTDGVLWNQLGATNVQAGTTSIFPGTADLEVGAINTGTGDRMAGRVFYAEVRNGIDGPIVANPAFDQSTGTVTFTDSVGNPWTIVPPASLIPFVPARMSARQKWARLSQEWSRNCSGATLVIFPDCYDPAASEEEKIYQGPYLVRGRPRVADIVWDRSNRGIGRATLRFDATDAALMLADTSPGMPWGAGHSHVVSSMNQNLLTSPDLEGLTMTVQGATVQDSFETSGGPSGPDGGPYFLRRVITPNTTSPFSMRLSNSSFDMLVNEGETYTTSWWAKQNPPGGQLTRMDYDFYDVGGTRIELQLGDTHAASSTWQRFSQTATAPPGARLVRMALIWTGTALAGQQLGFAQAWTNEGPVATSPDTLEVIGTLCSYPVITLNGMLSAPIRVTYGNHTFIVNENVVVPLTIDTRYGRAFEGGVDVTQRISGDFFSPLGPGVHDIHVESNDILGTDDGFAVLEWSNSVVAG